MFVSGVQNDEDDETAYRLYMLLLLLDDHTFFHRIT